LSKWLSNISGDAMEKEQETILLVDDDQDLLDIIKTRLEQHGYHVVACNNGKEALQAFPQVRPHLVLMDLEMPEQNGLTSLIELAETFQRAETSTEGIGSVPIIVITGLEGEALKDVVKRTGIVCDYMRKPINTEQLAAKIAQAISGASTQAR